MAQLSKKDQIAQAALGLFLEHGIKGTSVDMVVKTSGVSKPTVYNHFPDKPTLLSHTIYCFIRTQPVPIFKATTLNGLFKELTENWLTDDNLRLYGLFLGEGFRAPEAKTLFNEQFNTPWRAAVTQWAKTHQENEDAINRHIDAYIFNALFC